MHIVLGIAIASLRERNILIIGSGMSFHNLKTFFSNDIDSSKENEGFDHWLNVGWKRMSGGLSPTRGYARSGAGGRVRFI